MSHFDRQLTAIDRNPIKKGKKNLRKARNDRDLNFKGTQAHNIDSFSRIIIQYDTII